MKVSWKGVYPAATTAFAADQTLDLAATAAHCDALIRAGMHGLVLLGTVGMVSYWPYLGVTFALHVAVAGIVYVVVRREAPLAFALGAMALMLLLGSGGDDILWAFQSGTIGATAAGMAALVLAPRRPALAAILLTVALATSGVGLAWFVGTGVHLLLTRPRAIAWLLLPLGLYLVWFVLFATSSVSPGLGGGRHAGDRASNSGGGESARARLARARTRLGPRPPSDERGARAARNGHARSGGGDSGGRRGCDGIPSGGAP